MNIIMVLILFYGNVLHYYIHGYNYNADLRQFNIVEAKIPCSTTSRGTGEKCHQGRDLLRTCESQATQSRTLDLMWLSIHPPTVQPTSHIFLAFHWQKFPSGKCEEYMVCQNCIRNITRSCFIFYAIGISLINCV